MNESKSAKFFWVMVLIAITIGAVSTFSSNEYTNQIKEQITPLFNDIQNDGFELVEPPIEKEEL